MLKKLLFLQTIFLWLPGIYATSFDFDSACNNIASQAASIANTTVFFSGVVPAGTNLSFTNPTCDAAGVASFQVTLADMCRVALNVSTSDQSGIIMEAWLPRNWTGRFLSTGNGGLAGCIQYADLAYGAGLGFATVGANNGHNGSSGQAFYNHPEVLEDFVFRSIHTNVLVGKEITKTFYGSPHKFSYYFGCSTGGRQGFKSVQEFPDDFDGVLAGSPALNFNNLMSWFGRFFDILGTPDSPSFITADQWSGLIHENVLKQCDTIDGVADGIIEDPNLCDYKPEELICVPGSNSSDCLTATQAEALRQVFSPMYGLRGNLMYPRQQPGGEDTIYVEGLYTSGTPISFSSDWFHYVVYDPSFDVTKLNLTDYQYAEDLNPFNIATFNGDLSAFKARNGKVITYHGQADILISPTDTELYYNHVAQTMGLPPAELDDFMRFFRISGMSHCVTGDGAWQFGQSLLAVEGNLTAENLDPDRNALTALVRWVEEGIAPDTVLGTKYVNDTPELGVEFSRRHCRYPLRNTYDRVGDSSVPESWSCQ
ncbi:hypothetical protein GYMLUDRAFT_46582 [Collybiopsis luxurians FD-317 M1]|uniref:Carboxylic ester hydrolase n=1 Tax=Collybiopsis luxurians FD-317 M1 TaxID=944289 RepID=A0A0D0CFW0_9AGAR|nr:hypothetical protein GYMLUDRAFT_46582 [Collybiopsis luxurians FD-317 M1]